MRIRLKYEDVILYREQNNSGGCLMLMNENQMLLDSEGIPHWRFTATVL